MRTTHTADEHKSGLEDNNDDNDDDIYGEHHLHHVMEHGKAARGGGGAGDDDIKKRVFVLDSIRVHFSFKVQYKEYYLTTK
jgi:hypothetical protein